GAVRSGGEGGRTAGSAAGGGDGNPALPGAVGEHAEYLAARRVSGRAGRMLSAVRRPVVAAGHELPFQGAAQAGRTTHGKQLEEVMNSNSRPAGNHVRY